LYRTRYVDMTWPVAKVAYAPRYLQQIVQK
jgi:hypothetical protein